jgi:hypothetical protein
VILQPSEAPELHDNNPDYVNNNIYIYNPDYVNNNYMIIILNGQTIGRRKR